MTAAQLRHDHDQLRDLLCRHDTRLTADGRTSQDLRGWELLGWLEAERARLEGEEMQERATRVDEEMQKAA